MSPVVRDLPTRDLILREAKDCFARQGFEGTSLNDIAAGVGIRRPSLLHYFPSKEAIYQQVLLDALAEWGTEIERTRVGGLESWDLIDVVLEVSFRFFKDNPAIVLYPNAFQRAGKLPAGSVLQVPGPSAGYRFRKFARRNRAALMTGVLLSTVLVLGILVSTWQAIRATRSEH